MSRSCLLFRWLCIAICNMAQKRFLITNFAYGIGPYLRTTEIALSLNRELRQRGREDFAVHADSIFLDEKLGGILKTVFYEKETIEEALIRWNNTEKSASESAH